MLRHRRRTAVLGTVLAGGLTVMSGIVGTGCAGADGNSYLQRLHDAGINTPRGEYEMKEWGWEVCALRDAGKPPRQWVEQAVYQSGLHPPYGLTQEQANTIVDIAVSELCDDRDGPPPYLPAP